MIRLVINVEDPLSGIFHVKFNAYVQEDCSDPLWFG